MLTADTVRNIQLASPFMLVSMGALDDRPFGRSADMMTRCQLSQLAVVVALSTSACRESSGHHGADKGTGGVNGATSAGGASGMRGVSGVGDAKGASGAGGSLAGRGSGGAGGVGGSGGVSAMAKNDADDAGGASDAGGVGGTGAIPSPAQSCLDGITDFENAGPFQFEAKTAGPVKFWIPAVPSGCKIPVVHFANGTGATCASYVAILERLATHGFLAACYEDPNTSAGTQCITAVETALMMFPNLADNKIGSMAHGGAAAFTCVQLAEEKWAHSMIYTGLAMQPESGNASSDWMAAYAKIMSPMFMVSALGTDGLVAQAWVQQSFDALNDTDEAYFWTANGLKFVPVPVAEANEVSIPWFRWKLLGDQKACAFLKALPMTDTKWAQAASQNAQPCM
jgi:hypothetical protein